MENTETKKTFKDYQLDTHLISTLEQAGFHEPSPIQELTLAPVLEGKDVFAQAETGSGKTGSFAIPIIEQILRDRQHQEQEFKLQFPQYLVLSPTRELAQQTDSVFQSFGKNLGIKTACLIGGENIQKQKDELGEVPHVLVGTPGRIKDLLRQKSTSLKECKAVVFDEADRLFDMGFQKDVEDILIQAPKTRQLIMVSATSNQEILRLAYKMHSHPIELRINQDDLLVDNIDHKVAIISSQEKMPLLSNILKNHSDTYAIIFCNTQIQTHVIAEWLKRLGYSAKPISGALSQNKRTRLMQEFRDKEVTILVCTDVAARGLDIKDVNLVINYDLPQDASNYVHRIGRTGRAGKSGQAISLCGYEDCEHLDAIHEYLGTKIPKMEVQDSDFDLNVGKRPRIDKRTLQVIDEKSPREKSDTRTRERSERPRKMANVSANVTPRQRDESAPRPRKENLKESGTQEKRASDSREVVIKKDFEVSSYSFEKAQGLAMTHFDLNDPAQLASKVLAKGRRKFLLFGPQNCVYRFYLKPLKRIVLPFLIETIKLAKLDLYVNIYQNKANLELIFKGNDIGLLLTNRKQLLYSFETLTKVFLQDKLRSAKSVTVKARVEQQEDEQDSENKLIELIEKTKTRIKQTRRPVTLRQSLNPAQRRIIHKHLEGSHYKSESLGEGRMKKIQISLQK